MSEIEQYISIFPEEVQFRLNQVRNTILKYAPDVQEHMAYGMPAYKYKKKPLIYFAAFKNHIGLYATPSGHSNFADELINYKHGKGSVQFPHNEPFPLILIAKIIQFRVAENESLSIK